MLTLEALTIRRTAFHLHDTNRNLSKQEAEAAVERLIQLGLINGGLKKDLLGALAKCRMSELLWGWIQRCKTRWELNLFTSRSASLGYAGYGHPEIVFLKCTRRMVTTQQEQEFFERQYRILVEDGFRWHPEREMRWTKKKTASGTMV